jgi:hypothetical protein
MYTYSTPGMIVVQIQPAWTHHTCTTVCLLGNVYLKSWRDGDGIGGRPRINRQGSLKGGNDKPIFEDDDLEVDNAAREFVSMNFNKKSGSTIILESTMILMHQQKVGYILRPRGTRIIVDHSNRIALLNCSIQSPCCVTPSPYAVLTSEENQRGTFCRFVE